MQRRFLGLLFAALFFIVVLSAALASSGDGASAAAPAARLPQSESGKAHVQEPAAPNDAPWVDIAPFPNVTIDFTPVAVPLKLKRAGAAGYFPNGRLYVLGGRHGADGEDTTMRNIWEYNPGANTWAQKSALLDQSAVGSRWTANMAVAVLTNTSGVRIYAIGGSTIDSAITGTVRIYNPVADTLTTLTAADNWPASPARIPGGYTVYNNKLYIFGGFSALGTGAVFADTWVFDPMGAVGAKWTQLGTAPLRIARGYIAGATLDGKIYAIGGDTWNPSSRVLVPQTIVEQLDPTLPSPIWNVVASLPSPRGDLGAWSQNTGSGTYLAGNIMVAGGVYPVPDAKAFIYSAASNSWSTFPGLNHATRNYASAQLNNIVYAFGGYDYSANIPDGANFNQKLDASGAPPTATNTPVNSPTSTATPFSTNYSFCSFSGAAIVPGTTLVPGSQCSDEDCVVSISLPFPYTLYNQSFTAAQLAINGNMGFLVAEANAQAQCLPDPAANWAIFGYWDDLTTTGGGQGIFTSVTGSAPNRVFNIEWRASRTRTGTGTVNFEIRLFEGQTNFEIIYGTVAGGGDTAVVGVQRDTGSLSTQATCLTSGGLANGQRLHFQLFAGPCSTSTPTRTSTPMNTPTGTNTGTPTATPTNVNAFSAFSPSNPFYVAVGSRFTLDLMVNGGTNNVTAAQNYLTFDNNLLQNVDASTGGCVPASTLAPDLSTFDSALQNEVCNGPAPCSGHTYPFPGSIAFASGGLNNCGLASPCSGEFRVARIGMCASAVGSTSLHWQFAPPDPTGRNSKIIDINSQAVSNRNMYSDYSIQVLPAAPVTFKGHVTMEGRPNQPSPLQSVPVTLTLKVPGGGPETAYGTVTDMNGVFTVTMPPGTYQYKVKNPMTLANGGTMNILGNVVPEDLGLLRAGDASDDNCVDIDDFNILKNTFGRSLGDPQYDPRADFDGSDTVEVTDFNLLKRNFGTCGDELPAGQRP